MDPAALATAQNKLLEQGILGLVCFGLIFALVWALRGKGAAEKDLRDNDKARITEAKEITETLITASRNMAAVATALEASTRTQIESNAFRQQLAAGMESLEKAFEVLGDRLNDQGDASRRDLQELRAASTDVRKELQALQLACGRRG